MFSCRSVYLLIFDCVLEAALEELFKMSLRIYIREMEQERGWGGREEQGVILSSERPLEKHTSEEATCSKAETAQSGDSSL